MQNHIKSTPRFPKTLSNHLGKFIKDLLGEGQKLTVNESIKKLSYCLYQKTQKTG